MIWMRFQKKELFLEKNSFFLSFHSFIGDFFILESNGAIIALHQDTKFLPPNAKRQSTPLLDEAKNQLKFYFKGELRDFSLPFSLSRSEFENRIYHALSLIPYGATLSYQELAYRINSPNSARAIGNALAKNPLLLLIPCHRVICKSGKLGGYVLGEEKKRRLLKVERNQQFIES